MKVEMPKKLKCKRCGHQWQPRKENVIHCPHCCSPYWCRDRTRKPQRKKKEAALLK
jgi:Zn finger protein HypA/HybF involved in hydrogenase expression